MDVQVVAGTNYFVKVKIGGGEYIFLRIFVALPHANAPPELSDVQFGKTESDQIAYF